MTRRLLPILVALLFVPAAAAASGPSLHFTTFIATGLPLGGVVWTGSQMLYTTENDGTIAVSDAKGGNLQRVVQFNQGGEEIRCAPAPAKRTIRLSGVWQ